MNTQLPPWTDVFHMLCCVKKLWIIEIVPESNSNVCDGIYYHGLQASTPFTIFQQKCYNAAAL